MEYQLKTDKFLTVKLMTRKSLLLSVLILCIHFLVLGQKVNSVHVKNEFINVGCDLTRGGAIYYISKTDTSYNLINIHDEGRYVQQSYYAGNNVDRKNEGQAKNWSPWPWNPIQSGDAGTNRAKVVDYRKQEDTLYVKCRPLLWDMTNADTAECYLESWVWLEENIVHLKSKITVFRTDSIWGVGVRNQELPAVYPIADLNKLVSYKGNKPWTGDTLSGIDNRKEWEKYEKNGTWPWIKWKNPEKWAACVNSDDWGLGVYCPVAEAIAGGYSTSRKKISGKYNSGTTGYIAPLADVNLGMFDTYEYQTDLIIGTVDEIRNYVYQKKNKGVGN